MKLKGKNFMQVYVHVIFRISLRRLISIYNINKEIDHLLVR